MITNQNRTVDTEPAFTLVPDTNIFFKNDINKIKEIFTRSDIDVYIPYMIFHELKEFKDIGGRKKEEQRQIGKKAFDLILELQNKNLTVGAPKDALHIERGSEWQKDDYIVSTVYWQLHMKKKKVIVWTEDIGVKLRVNAIKHPHVWVIKTIQNIVARLKQNSLTKVIKEIHPSVKTIVPKKPDALVWLFLDNISFARYANKELIYTFDDLIKLPSVQAIVSYETLLKFDNYKSNHKETIEGEGSRRIGRRTMNDVLDSPNFDITYTNHFEEIPFSKEEKKECKPEDTQFIQTILYAMKNYKGGAKKIVIYTASDSLVLLYKKYLKEVLITSDLKTINVYVKEKEKEPESLPLDDRTITESQQIPPTILEDLIKEFLDAEKFIERLENEKSLLKKRIEILEDENKSLRSCFEQIIK